jgi:hypothetical protein
LLISEGYVLHRVARDHFDALILRLTRRTKPQRNIIALMATLCPLMAPATAFTQDGGTPETRVTASPSPAASPRPAKPGASEEAQSTPEAPSSLAPQTAAKPFRVARAVAIIVKAKPAQSANPELVKSFDSDFAIVCAALRRNLVAGPESPWGLSPFHSVACEVDAPKLKIEESSLIYRIEAQAAAKTFVFRVKLAGGGAAGVKAALDEAATKGSKPVAQASVRATRVSLAKLKVRRFSKLVAATLVDGMPFLARVESESHPALVKPEAPSADPNADVTLPSTGGVKDAKAGEGATSGAEAIYALPPGPTEFSFAQFEFNPKNARLRKGNVKSQRVKTAWLKGPVWSLNKAGRNKNRAALAKKVAQALKVVDPAEVPEDAGDAYDEKDNAASDWGTWRLRGQFSAGALRELNFSSGGFSLKSSLRLGVGGPYPGYPYVMTSYGRAKIFLLTEGDSQGDTVSITLSRLRYGGGWRLEFPFAGGALLLFADPYAASERSSVKTQGIEDLGSSLSDEATATLYGAEAGLALSSENLGVQFFGGVERSLKKTGGYSSWGVGALGQYVVASHGLLGSTWRHSIQLLISYESFAFELAPQSNDRVFDVALSVSQPGAGLGYLVAW